MIIKSSGLYFFLLITIVLFFGCRKKPQNLFAKKIIAIDNSISINDIEKVNDSLMIAVGGKPNEIGKIFLSHDNGQHWIENQEIGWCYYSIFILNDSIIYVGGDSITLIKSTDFGNTWQSLINYSFLDWQSFVTPIRGIFFTDENHGYLVGGDNYIKGILCTTQNGGNNWKFKDFSNEFSAVLFTNSQTGYIAGYGKILKTTDSGETWKQENFKGDNVKKQALQNNQLWACGYKGNIYTQIDNNWGKSFQISEWNNKIHWRDIICSSTGQIIVVGNSGMVYLQNTDKLFQGNHYPNFLAITEINETTFCIAGEDGNVYIYEVF